MRHSAYAWGFLRVFVWLETQVYAPFTAILRGIRVDSGTFLSRIWEGCEPRPLPTWQVRIVNLTERMVIICITVSIATFSGNLQGHFPDSENATIRREKLVTVKPFNHR